MRKQWACAPHPSEILYVFDTVSARYRSALTFAEERASRLMNSRGVRFAKTGDRFGKG